MNLTSELIKLASQYRKLVSDIKKIENADIINQSQLATTISELIGTRKNIRELSSQIEEPLENFPERKLLREIRANKDFISKKALEKIPQLKELLLLLKKNTQSDLSNTSTETLIEYFQNNPEEVFLLASSLLKITSGEEKNDKDSDITDEKYFDAVQGLHERIDPYSLLERQEEFSALYLGRNIPPIVKRYYSLIRDSYLVASDSGAAVFCRSLLEVVTFHILKRNGKKNNIKYPIYLSGDEDPRDSILKKILEEKIIVDKGIREKARQVRWNVNKIMHPYSKIDKHPSFTSLSTLEIIRNTFDVIEYLYP